jgi:hypothetical protein
MHLYETTHENVDSINLARSGDRWPDPVMVMNIRDP